MVELQLEMHGRNSAVFCLTDDYLCKSGIRRILTMPIDSFVRIHGRVHPKAPAVSIAKSWMPYKINLNYLVRGNDNVDTLENIIPYPLFTPEINIIGPRKDPCIECRKLGRQSLMLLFGQGDGWNAKPYPLQKALEGQRARNDPCKELYHA